ncbi:MAG: hypothetical protein RL685_4400 [Pseudomonadota bacterium]|jgi:predicted component of type VI protein secretion system
MNDSWSVEVQEADESDVRSYVCSALPITIGRHEGNDVRLGRPFVSSFHARIEQARAGLSVTDLASTNGVLVQHASGKELRIASHQPHALSRCENQFSIGAYRIRIRSADPFAAAASDPLSLPSFTARGSCDVAEPAAPPSLPGYDPIVPHSRRDRVEGSQRRACEAMALAALEELARALTPGQQLNTPEEVAQLIGRLQLSLELSCRGLVRLRRGQRRCASALRLPLAASDAGLATEDAEQLTRQLLDARVPLAELRAGLGAEFQALARHQVALLEGMIEGAGALLEELSPERIEARAEGQRASRWLPLAGKLRSLQRAYREHHAQLRRKDGALSLVFGRAFRDAYTAYLGGAQPRPALVPSARRPGKLR